MAHRNIEIQYESRGSIRATRTGMTTPLVFTFILDKDLLDYGDPDLNFNDQSDDAVALRYAYQILPQTRVTINADLQKQLCVLDQLNLDHIGPNTYKATATYKLDVNRGVGRAAGTQQFPSDPYVLPFIRIEFNIGGGTKHITKSREVKSVHLANLSPLPGAPPNDECAIGINEDGLDGTEVVSAELRVQITAYYKPTYITLNFVKTVRNIIAGKYNTGSYNDDVFLGFESGEVQLRNASGGGTVVDIIPITFDFSIKQNVTNEVDEGFANLTMLGHDYVDYIYLPRVDATGKRILQYPEIRYVHRIAEPADYSLLRIPQP